MGNEVGKGRYARMDISKASVDSSQIDRSVTQEATLSKGNNDEQKIITEFGDNSEQRSAASEKIAETFSKLNNGYQILARKSQENVEAGEISSEVSNKNMEQTTTS